MPAGPLTYVIIDLGTLGGGSSVATAINNHGQAVGSADTRQGIRRAFLWEHGIMQELGTLPGFSLSEATDINDLEQVIGISTNSRLPGSETASFLWYDGSMTDLGHLGKTVRDTQAHALNATGCVVGSSRLSLSVQHAFQWCNGFLTDLADMTGESWTTARAINVHGLIAGPFLWDGVTITSVGTLGGDISQVFGLNDNGSAVGWSERIPGQRIFHAFLWQNDEILDLGHLGDFSASRAEAINNRGAVVGEPRFIYDATDGIRDVLDLIPPESSWFRYALDPEDINDTGQIVGTASFPGGRHTFLMTPIDTDFDDDGDSDWNDAGWFVLCMSGPDSFAGDACQSYDVDRDGHTDLKDARALQWTFSGP